MHLSSAPNRTLMLRRLRNELFDVNDRAQTARQTLLALVADIRDARGVHPKMADRLAAIEARLDALEAPPPSG